MMFFLLPMVPVLLRLVMCLMAQHGLVPRLLVSLPSFLVPAGNTSGSKATRWVTVSVSTAGSKVIFQ